MNHTATQNVQPQLPFDITARKHGGNPESKAANPMKEDKQQVRAEIMAYIRSKGIYGATADQVAEHFNCSPNHVAPRISELKMLGKLKPLGRRKTRSGCTAAVLVEK